MLQHEESRKLIFLLLLVCVVLGIFFFQNRNMVFKQGPQPTPTPIAASSGNILVSTPYNEGSVGPSFIVTGKARVFENVVSLRVSNKVLGKIYYSGTVVTNAPDTGTFGEFATQVDMNTHDFSLKPNDRITLEVFQSSPKDGSDTDVVTIPLYFTPALP